MSNLCKDLFIIAEMEKKNGGRQRHFKKFRSVKVTKICSSLTILKFYIEDLGPPQLYRIVF